MYYEITNSYGKPLQVYSDYNLADVREHLKDIYLCLEDFNVDEESSFGSVYDYDNNYWVDEYYNDWLKSSIDGFDDEDSRGNYKYNQEDIYREILDVVVDGYKDLQENSIDKAWEFYSKQFGKHEFEMLLENLAEEYKTELEEDEDFDILEPFFKLDNSELIEILDLDYREFLHYRSFEEIDLEEISDYMDLEEWLKDMNLENYLNDKYKEDDDDEEDED